MEHITAIRFENYKSFSQFTVTLNQFNILVGPNNAGKSTVIGALKILSEGIKKAKARKPIPINSPTGEQILGYPIELSQVPVATENVFHNYEDSVPAIIKFKLSSGNHLQIFFPENGKCFFNIESNTYRVLAPKDYKEFINIEIGFVPILGPVDHVEKLYQKEAARLALLSHTASRNFRNIWFHYSNNFNEFAELVRTTWPGMDISFPEIVSSTKETTLAMFCPEDRMPREIFWAGFGFQVWCQMLTYIVQNKNSTLFLIDEPDIYLHSDLQRQLLGILKGLGPDIIIATHSTELISEAEINDILLINKTKKTAQRIKDPTQLREIFQVLGSNLNPVLTQIAKTRRVLFVEGKDFSILSKIARILRKDHVANRADFAIVPVEGYNPSRLKILKEGIEKTIGTDIISAVIFDKDYRSSDEVKKDVSELGNGHLFAYIHSCKEIENYLLVPEAIKKAITSRINESNTYKGTSNIFNENINQMLLKITDAFKNKTQAQIQSFRLKYEKINNPRTDESTIIERILEDFEHEWSTLESRLRIIPGKDFLSQLNKYLQEQYSITITQANIINGLKKELIPRDLIELIEKIESFRTTLHSDRNN